MLRPTLLNFQLKWILFQNPTQIKQSSKWLSIAQMVWGRQLMHRQSLAWANSCAELNLWIKWVLSSALPTSTRCLATWQLAYYRKEFRPVSQQISSEVHRSACNSYVLLKCVVKMQWCVLGSWSWSWSCTMVLFTCDWSKFWRSK